jgi:F0F1-type ATP synthase membrane subunit b/b'
MLRKELQTVLEIEREGEKRLALAREDAARIVEGFRRQAGDLIRATEEEIARTRERATADADEETNRLVAEIRREVHEKESFLHSFAERNRRKAVNRIFELIGE